jgi:hypothetical protein
MQSREEWFKHPEDRFRISRHRRFQYDRPVAAVAVVVAEVSSAHRVSLADVPFDESELNLRHDALLAGKTPPQSQARLRPHSPSLCLIGPFKGAIAPSNEEHLQSLFTV